MVKRQEVIQEPELIDETVIFSLHELCQVCGVHAELIIEMVEHGVLEPQGKSPTEWRFTVIALQRSRSALRLQQDLGVNWSGAALALDLLEEVRELRAQIKFLQQLTHKFR